MALRMLITGGSSKTLAGKRVCSVLHYDVNHSLAKVEVGCVGYVCLGASTASP